MLSSPNPAVAQGAACVGHEGACAGGLGSLLGGGWLGTTKVGQVVLGLFGFGSQVQNMTDGVPPTVIPSVIVAGSKAEAAALRAAEAASGAANANAAAALASKLSALEGAQATAARVRVLPDGRIRYYEAERAARTAGPSRGSSYATEWNPANGNVRSWNEVYDQAGEVNRVHPKMINGQTVNSLHYPPTAKELGGQ